MFDLGSLDYRDFERLIENLLIAEKYLIASKARPGTRGPDFEAVAPNGRHYFIEVKHFKRSMGSSNVIKAFSVDVDRYRQQIPNSRGLLIFSRSISEREKSEFLRFEDIDVWSEPEVLSLLERHPSIASMFEVYLKARADAVDFMANTAQKSAPAAIGNAQTLAAIPPGKDGWKKYEEVGSAILTKLFSPSLGPPQIQNRSDDGLDIMDAIFPIRSASPPWSLIRSEFATRFVVAEFKNYTDPIGQNQIESIA